MSSTLGIGTSALLAYQRALGVTAHNVANAGNPDYTRQSVKFSARTPDFLGNGFFGTGTNLVGVDRVFDGFVESRLRSASSNKHQSAEIYDYAQRVDRLLADPDVGLSPGLQRFFAATSDVSNDPTSTAARQVLLSESEALVSRFQFLDQRLQEERDLVNSRIDTTISEINALSSAMADLNRDIKLAVQRTDANPNDLLDQRDALARELSERVGLQILTQPDQTMSVFIGNGQPLVIGDRASPLVATSRPDNPTELTVAVPRRSGAPVDISAQVSGGRLGALLDARSEMLDKSQNALGRTALGLVQAFNAQHVQGQDLNSDQGKDFFGLGQLTHADGVKATVLGRAQDVGNTSVPEVVITDIGKLTTDDYLLEFNGADWSLRPVGGGTAVALADAETNLGLRVDIPADNWQEGDRFRIQPTRGAVQHMTTLITEPREVAAAAPPMQLQSVTDDDGNDVTRSVSIVRDFEQDLNRSPFTLEFDGDEWTVDGQALTTVTPALGNPWQLEVQGWSIEIADPVAGDIFEFALGQVDPGDNGNMLQLSGLQHKLLLNGDTMTLNDSYNTLIAEVGTQTRRAEISARSQELLLEQVRAQREAISGVNLDEEAANLLRFQQAYQGAAQVIATTSTLFETLLSVVRR